MKLTKTTQLPTGFETIVTTCEDKMLSSFEVRNDAGELLGYIGQAEFTKAKRGTGEFMYPGGPWIPAVMVPKREWLACDTKGNLWSSFETTKAAITHRVVWGDVEKECAR